MKRHDVSPSGEQARQWLQEELAKGEYHADSLLPRVLRWFGEQLSQLRGAPADSAPSLPPAVSAAVLALLLAALALLLTRVRADRRAESTPPGVLAGVAASAAELRRQGRDALGERRFADAVVHYTRAIARDGADRTLLADAPSLTAHEIGTRLAEVFPAQAGAIRQCTDTFDAVRYGRYAATADDAAHARATCEALLGSRPVLTPLDAPGGQPPVAAAALRQPQ